MRLPPRWTRRLLLQPLFIVVTAVVSLLSPLLLIMAAVASPFVEGRWRPLRACAFTILWMQQEVATIIACVGIWIVGVGRLDTAAVQRRHYILMRWFLRRARVLGGQLLGVTVEIGDDGTAERVLAANDRPLLVFSRHAGPGDTLYLVDMLLDRYGRAPRIVMKEILKLDPCIDLAGSRVPNCFLPPPTRRHHAAWEECITSLALGLGDTGALLLFPEGGNFSETRRFRRLTRLVRRGRRDEAERAMGMRHVIAPEPGGALTAIKAAPEASVILVAHGGLAGLEGGGLLGRAPMDRVFRVHLWYIDAATIPQGDEAQRSWLLDCWQRIDDWIGETEEERAMVAPAPR